MTKKIYFNIYLKIVFCLIFCFGTCPALSAIAKQELRGKVYILGENDKRIPVTNTTVRIQNTDDSNITTSTGMFRIFLPDIFKAGETVTLEVQKPKYQILYPLAGKIRIPASSLKDPVEILLDKEGSHRFMSGKAFALLIENIANKSKQQIKADDQRKEMDLSRYLKQWAVTYGFGIEHVQTELDKWAADVQERQENFYELALAAFYKKNFKEAADKSYQSARQYEKQLAELSEQEKRINEKKKQIKENITRDYRLAGDAYYNDYRFEEALTSYRNALAVIDEAVSPQEWASLMNDISTTYLNLGIRAEGSASRVYLKKAADGYRKIFKVYTRESLPKEWAGTQNNMGIVLIEQGIRTEGEEGARLLSDAIKAYKAALTVRTRESLPMDMDWAMTQNNMGNALSQLQSRTGEEESVRLLSEAIEAYKAALTVITINNLPQLWAMIQNNIGNALLEQGKLTVGEESTSLLVDAVTAYKAALTVRTRKKLPYDWAMTQNNLGIALSEQGAMEKGEESTRLLNKAVEAYKAALTVCTRESSPQGWAAIQNNMGSAYLRQGNRNAEKGDTRLLREAEEAFNAALTVYTRENMAQDWAMTQDNLGSTLLNQGIRTEGEEGIRLLREAVKAFNNALQVRTFKYFPLQWAKTYKNLADTYYAMQDWADAAKSYCKVLKVFKKDNEAYERASYIYHEKLFQFDKAYSLSYYWVSILENVNTSSMNKFIETHFTTARFKKAEEIVAELLPKWNHNDFFYIPLCSIEIANLVALKKTDMISGKIDTLISAIKQKPEDYTIGWTFIGTKHFIKNSEQLKPDSQWLLSFFTAIEGPNRDAIVKGLQDVLKDFNKSKKQ